MAIVTHQKTGTALTNPSEIQGLLAQHDLVFEQWDISKYDPSETPSGATAQEHILTAFSKEVAAISEARGYQSADVIALRPDTPNLDAICAKFDKEHTHTEEEVRFVVDGRGVFAVRGNDGDLYDVELHPGDLLAVPEGKQHYFFLCEDKNIQCIRLFSDPAGWVAEYVD
jgi:1,2-dihydroxy-3-keto-5-methylthiopentene dioxygenase